MAKRFRACNLDQAYLLPPSLHDWLPERHLARFLAELTSELDLGKFYSKYEEGDGRGLAAYDPEMMVRLLLYAYCVGKRSSRQIEKATYEDLAFRYLSADQHPDHDTIANFRKSHLESLAELFGQVLRLCRNAGMVKLGPVAIDGTKVQANASPSHTVKYKQLEETEREIERRVKQILDEAAAADDKDDERYGRGRSDEDLPDELATSQARLKKIREAKEKLEQEAHEKAAQAEAERRDNGGKHASQASKKRFHRATADIRTTNPQHNFTDPDSKLMKDAATGGYLQAYNAQIAVAEGSQIIVAAEVSREPGDRSLLPLMAGAVKSELNGNPEVLLADAGYFSVEAIECLKQNGCDCLISPERFRGRHREAVQSHNTAKHRWAVYMREQLRSEAGRKLYQARRCLVEPVFGQIKAARNIRAFLLRSIQSVRAEWRLVCLTHNLLKLFRQRCPG